MDILNLSQNHISSLNSMIMMKCSNGMVFYNIYWLIITCLLDVIITILDGMVKLLMFNLIWVRVLTNQEMTLPMP